MTELIFDLDGRAITISIIAPGETDAHDSPWLLHARWDDGQRSHGGSTAIHAGASLEDFSHQGLARIVHRIQQSRTDHR